MKAFIQKSDTTHAAEGLSSCTRESTYDSAKTIIVEFNGLTGLGKTTVAKALIEELTKQGSRVIDKSYRYCYFHSMHHPFPVLFSPHLYWLVESFARSLTPKKKRSHVNKISYYAQKYKSIIKHSHADFAIIDEAIIQFFAAIAFNDVIPVSEKVDAIIRKLKRLNIDFIRIDCVPNVDEAEKRIMSRPTKKLKVERMRKEDRVHKLETEAANINYLRSVFSKIYENQHVITIDTIKESPLNNARVIMDYIINIKNENSSSR